MRTLTNPSITHVTTASSIPGTPWSTRLLAALGFLLALAVVCVAISRQLAISTAQMYMRQHYNTTVELPVRTIRPEFLTGTTASGKPLPPLGFCWTIELESGGSQAEITINPWTHDIVDWSAQL